MKRRNQAKQTTKKKTIKQKAENEIRAYYMQMLHHSRERGHKRYQTKIGKKIMVSNVSSFSSTKQKQLKTEQKRKKIKNKKEMNKR